MKQPFETRTMPRFSSILVVAFLATTLLCSSSVAYPAGDKAGKGVPEIDRVFIEHIEPDSRGGQAYKLVYVVRAPMEFYWKFKTDFDNDVLTTNEYIQEHRLISRSGDTVITEDRYAHVPGVVFKWETNVFPKMHRLEFVLLNPEECRQRYHYGHIRLESVPEGTRVTQTAYFDFWGASLWARFPWRGGMRDFLTYSAQWEQDTVLRLMGQNHVETSK